MGLDATAKKAATSVSSQIFSPSDITKAVGENIVQIGDDLFNSGNIPLRTTWWEECECSTCLAGLRARYRPSPLGDAVRTGLAMMRQLNRKQGQLFY
jgi:hypothetical protein